MAFSRLVVLMSLAPCLLVASGCVERGTWWYGHWDKEEAGSIKSFYDETKEPAGRPAKFEAMISRFKACQIDDVYGYYTGEDDKVEYPNDDLAWMAAWNEALHKERLKSWLLISKHSYLDNPRKLIERLDEDLGPWYSANSPSFLKPDSFFYGLHLDIEPETFANCKEAGGPHRECYALLLKLRTLVIWVRLWIAIKAPNLKLSIYLDHSFDELQGNKRIVWSGAGERDTWYKDIAEEVDEISVMANSKDVQVAKGRVEWELGETQKKRKVPTTVRVGLNWERFLNGVKPEDASDAQRQQAVKAMTNAARELWDDGRHVVDLFQFNELYEVCKPK